MRILFTLVCFCFVLHISAQVDSSLDNYEEYLIAVKADAELYEMHRSAIRCSDRAQGYGITSSIFLGLAAFGAVTVNAGGGADPQPGSLVLMNLGGILGGLTGLVAWGSYSKGKSKKSEIKRLLDERYDLIDNYTLSIKSSSNGIGLVLSF